ncbi:MAG: CtsR family transcriptional regulator, partial [Tissierellia bacterium]|nr:CtsR family transcriptional regulator [Tissierellia bacterium]
GHIIKAALSDRSLNSKDPDLRNRLRADILKNILLILVK